jgi:NhaP-type Na+/H+ and K+/H+ antiporter
MMRGIGERLDVPLKFPRLHAVLVNPGKAASTPAVFAAIGLEAGERVKARQHSQPAEDMSRAAVLALLLLQLALGDLPDWQEVAGLLLLRLGGGALLGALAGGLLVLLLERLPEDADALRLQLSLGVLFLLVAGSQFLLPEAGFPAAVIAGVVVGLRLDQQASQLDDLIFQLAQLAITVLFPLLAADLSWSELSPLGWGGGGCVLALMVFRFGVLQVAGLGIPSLIWRDKLLLSWVAPRGIAGEPLAGRRLSASAPDRQGLSGLAEARRSDRVVWCHAPAR